MMNNITLQLLGLLLGILFIGILSSCASDDDPFPRITIPVFPNALRVTKLINKPSGTKAVAYKLETAFPSQDVISFYDQEFKNSGFIKYSDDAYGTREWENYNSNSGKWEKTTVVPAQYIATWTDKGKKVRIVLVMRYKYDNSNKQWDKELLVSCTVATFFRLDEGDER